MSGRERLGHPGLAWLGALSVVICLVVAGPAAGQTSDPAVSLLTAAERRARDGDLSGALGDYEQLIRQFPDSKQAPEAMLRIAEGQLSQGDRVASLATVERLVTTYPRAAQAAGGLLLEGQIRSELPEQIEDLEGARKTLEKAWLLFRRSTFPTLPARSAARVLDGELALRLGQESEATTSFLDAVETEPISPATADAHVGLATALVRTGDWQAAAESLQAALEVPEASPESLARARRRLGLLERRLLRPAAGKSFWAGARPVAIAGPPQKRVTGVAVSDEGRLVVIDSGENQALLISPDGQVEKRWTLRGGEKPSWGRGAQIQIASQDSVILPGEAAHQFGVRGKDKPLDGIRAAEQSPFGRWILLAQRSIGVVSYTPDRRSFRTILAGDDDPADLALDSLDRLYILERKSRRVLRVNQHDDSREVAVKGNWKKPEAVAVDPFGYIHVLDSDENRVHTYDRTGAEITVVGPMLPGNVELRKAEDLAVGGDGRLYIADSRTGLIVLE